LTLKGQQNHYSIKFLKGYGHSISVKDSKIILKDCHDPFSEPEIESWIALKKPLFFLGTAVIELLSFCLSFQELQLH